MLQLDSAFRPKCPSSTIIQPSSYTGSLFSNPTFSNILFTSRTSHLSGFDHLIFHASFVDEFILKSLESNYAAAEYSINRGHQACVNTTTVACIDGTGIELFILKVIASP